MTSLPLSHEEMIQQKIKQLGLEFDTHLLETSIVSIPNAEQDKMFEEFLKLLKEFNDDKNVFKFGVLPKPGLFTDDQKGPIALLHAIGESDFTKKFKETGRKPRYHFINSFLQAYHTACSAQERDNKYFNRSDQYVGAMSSFINFKSLLSYREAGHENPDEQQNEPSEKIKKGILGR